MRLVDREQRDAAPPQHRPSIARQLGIISRSGDTYSRSSAPSRISRSTAAASPAASPEFSVAARTPACRRASTWSFINAISGETTTPSPGRSSAGN
jgi:hypothetical protein